MSAGAPAARAHLAALRLRLRALDAEIERIDALGTTLAEVLLGGGRLLAAGNGGSAAHAQHLTAELVGRYVTERRPLSAIALCAETSSLTAIGNDYGGDEVFARQVHAHGRPGDVLVLISTSGSSPNLVAAAEAGHDAGMRVWALTGAAPNPLAELAHECVSVAGPTTATVQEVHQVIVHLVCSAVDAHVAAVAGRDAGAVTR